MPTKSGSKVLRTITGWFLLFGLTAMIGLVPPLGNFLSNRHEASVQDLILPILGVLAIALIVATVFYRSFRRHPLSGFVATIIAAVLLTNNYDGRFGDIYPFLSAILPLPKLDGATESVFSLIFIVMIFLGAATVGRLTERFRQKHNWPTKDIVVGGALAITVAFALILLPTIKVIAGSWPQYFYRPPQLQANLSPSGNQPDVYYIVLDRYASQDVLTKQFNYSNADFMNFLKTSGYYVNPTSHQNYPYTTQSVASTLNAGYNADAITKFGDASNQTLVTYHQSIKYAGVTQAFKQAGYRFNQIGTWYEATNQAPLADQFYLLDRRLTLLNRTVHIDSLTLNALAQSPFWRFIKSEVKVGNFTIASYQDQDQIEMTKYALNTLKELANQPSGGRFIFAHLLIPHDPYHFNPDGSISKTSNSDNVGEPIKQKYLGQVEYINRQMKLLLTRIKDQSHGQAVVILQSDEGPYPIQLNDENFNSASANEEVNDLDMRSWSDTNLAMKYGNLAAYYIPEATPADLAQGANTLNIFRVVLNRYLGTNLSYLPECYYAYPKGRSQPLVYDDITKRLTGQANPACAADGTGAK